MQIVIDIDDDNLADKIIKILNVFKNDGLKIKTQPISTEEKRREYSDEYIEENWLEMVMTSDDNSHYYKSDKYYEDRATEYEKRSKN